MRGSNGSTMPTRVPEELRRALESYEIRVPQQLEIAGLGAGREPDREHVGAFPQSR